MFSVGAMGVEEEQVQEWGERKERGQKLNDFTGLGVAQYPA